MDADNLRWQIRGTMKQIILLFASVLMGCAPNSGDRSAGRYTVVRDANLTYLLDTATADMWLMTPSDRGSTNFAQWVKFPNPTKN